MLLDARNPDEVPDKGYSKVVIIGAGTIGLVMALDFAKAQMPVTVVEAGGRVADTTRGRSAGSLAGRSVLVERACFGVDN